MIAVEIMEFWSMASSRLRSRLNIWVTRRSMIYSADGGSSVEGRKKRKIFLTVLGLKFAFWMPKEIYRLLSMCW